MFSFPESVKVVTLYQGAANAVACDVISCKLANKVWFKITHTGSADTDLVLSLYEATDVAAGTNAAITATCPIWENTSLGTSNDVLSRVATDAYAYTIDTGVAPARMVIIEWDPAKHTEGYDCVYLADSGGNASNVVNIEAIIDPKFQGTPLPAFITD